MGDMDGMDSFNKIQMVGASGFGDRRFWGPFNDDRHAKKNY